MIIYAALLVLLAIILLPKKAEREQGLDLSSALAELSNTKAVAKREQCDFIESMTNQLKECLVEQGGVRKADRRAK